MQFKNSSKHSVDCQQTSDSVTEPVYITTSSIAATNPTPNSNSEISPYSTPAPDSKY